MIFLTVHCARDIRSCYFFIVIKLEVINLNSSVTNLNLAELNQTILWAGNGRT